jgi:methylglutamate dehydrogenase subunit D
VANALSVIERDDLGLAIIQARKGVDATMIGNVLGVAAPTGPSRAGDEQFTLIGLGTGAWLAVCGKPEGDWPERVGQQLTGLASVTDQSSAYCVLRLTGTRVAELLQRGISIDLHPESFGTRSAAATVMEAIGVIVWRFDAGAGFELAVPRSYVSSVRHWLAAH